jgi:hypothetical protein
MKASGNPPGGWSQKVQINRDCHCFLSSQKALICSA